VIYRGGGVERYIIEYLSQTKPKSSIQLLKLMDTKSYSDPMYLFKLGKALLGTYRYHTNLYERVTSQPLHCILSYLYYQILSSLLDFTGYHSNKYS